MNEVGQSHWVALDELRGHVERLQTALGSALSRIDRLEAERATVVPTKCEEVRQVRQAAILGLLRKVGIPLPVFVIADALNEPAGTITGNLLRMAEEGLVVRHKPPHKSATFQIAEETPDASES